MTFFQSILMSKYKKILKKNRRFKVGYARAGRIVNRIEMYRIL